MFELAFLIFLFIVVGEVISLNWDSLTEEDIMDKWWQDKIKWGYTKENGEPIKCFCGCTLLKFTITDKIDNTVCEEDVHCIRCGKLIGHWAYGSWEPM